MSVLNISSDIDHLPNGDNFTVFAHEITNVNVLLGPFFGKRLFSRIVVVVALIGCILTVEDPKLAVAFTNRAVLVILAIPADLRSTNCRIASVE